MTTSTFDRRSEIIRYVREQQRISTRMLSEMFEVSEVTIRNDLKVLSEQGWLQRVHGGAEVIQRLLPEQPFQDRQYVHPDEKANIARTASAMVGSGDTILLDSSTTAYQLALQLKDSHFDLRVVTNNIQVVTALYDNPGIETIILGGVVRGKTSSVVGSMAMTMLSGMHVDKGFFSASGLSLERGFTDADSREVEIKRAMVGSAAEVIIMLDASKFGQQSFLTFATLDEIDQVITEGAIPAEYQQALSSAGIQLNIIQTTRGN